MSQSDPDREDQGDDGIGSGVGADYFCRVRSLYRIGSPIALYEHELIVTTPTIWASRPESSDPTWRVFDESRPLVVACRMIG